MEKYMQTQNVTGSAHTQVRVQLVQLIRTEGYTVRLTERLVGRPSQRLILADTISNISIGVLTCTCMGDLIRYYTITKILTGDGEYYIVLKMTKMEFVG